ncbi:MAG: cytochrome c biogenesis protein CcsA [Gammaproteobacteria bacterium]|nr:MAG: cytochrome C biogenesis protein [Gammaproteobacteria bacterium]UCH38952.1 MAG: cytochrome c biogenesis protein CcsA [Gammaproteobacteria bacterium]
MFPTIASALATVCYCLSAFLIYKQLGTAQHQRWVALAPAAVGMLLQAASLNMLIIQPQGLNLGFFAAFSLIAWLISIQILLSSIYRRIESLGIIVFPVSGFASIFASLHFTDHLITTSSNAIQGHIMVSVIAYSLITLGAFQAGLLAYQDRSIRHHHPGGFIRFLPPLHDMETLLFQFLAFGFVCLSVSLLTGFLFVEDIFEQKQTHKVVLSSIAWVILGVLLFGRVKFGWRGKTAIRWTLSAFVFLMLAFFGSKLVLEFILA